MQMQHASPAMREYIAAQLEHVAKLLRVNEISGLEYQTSNHVVEVPSNASYIVRECVGVARFLIDIRFPPGVDLPPPIMGGEAGPAVRSMAEDPPDA